MLDGGGQGDCCYRAASVSYAIATGRDLKCQETGRRSVFQSGMVPRPYWTEQTEGGRYQPLTRSGSKPELDRADGSVDTLIGISSRLKRDLVRVAFIAPRVEFLAFAVGKHFGLEPTNIGCGVLLEMPKCQAV